MHQFAAILLADMGGLFFFPIALCALAFWVWMLFDCAKYEEEVGAKIVWILLIFSFGVICAPLYFFFRHLPRKRRMCPRSTGPVLQPWNKNQRLG